MGDDGGYLRVVPGLSWSKEDLLVKFGDLFDRCTDEGLKRLTAALLLNDMGVDTELVIHLPKRERDRITIDFGTSQSKSGWAGPA